MKKFIALGLLLVNAAANAVPYNISALGSLSPGGDSTAYALNDNGQVVGQSYNSTSGQLESVIWNGGVVQSLGVTGIARGINNSGVVAGETGSANIALPSGYAYSWTSTGGINNLGTLGGSYSGAWDINEAGVITGFAWPTGAAVSTFGQGFIYENGVMTSLGTVSSPTGYSRGHGINDSNEIVGRASLVDFGGSEKQLAYWDSDQNINSYAGPSDYSAGQQINNNGLITGNARKVGGGTAQYAATWDTSGNISFMNDLGGDRSRAWSANDDDIIVGYSRKSGADDFYATISYDGTNFIDLNTLVDLTGTGFVSLTEAYDINASGQIVGIGTLSTGEQGAFIMTVVPIPAAAWLFASGLGLLGWIRRGRNNVQKSSAAV